MNDYKISMTYNKQEQNVSSTRGVSKRKNVPSIEAKHGSNQNLKKDYYQKVKVANITSRGRDDPKVALIEAPGYMIDEKVQEELQ